MSANLGGCWGVSAGARWSCRCCCCTAVLSEGAKPIWGGSRPAEVAKPIRGGSRPAEVSLSLLLPCRTDSKILLGEVCRWISSISTHFLDAGVSIAPGSISGVDSCLPVSCCLSADEWIDDLLDATDDFLDLTVASSSWRFRLLTCNSLLLSCNSLIASAIFLISSLRREDEEDSFVCLEFTEGSRGGFWKVWLDLEIARGGP